MALVEGERVRLPDPGQKGDLVAPVIQAYQALGVTISRDTIFQLRAGATGVEIARAVAAAEIVKRGTASSKDAFFKEYGVLGIMKRKKRTDDRSKAFGYMGLTKELAQKLGVPEAVLRNLVKAARIDLFYTPADQLGIVFPTNYREAVEAYLKDLGRYKNKQEAEEIARRWGRSKTVKNFTQIILNQPREIVAAWTPYETEPAKTLAINRLKNSSPLTPFDTMVLKGIDGIKSDAEIIAKIKADIGITIDRHVIENYRALLLGRITTSAKKADQSAIQG